MIDKLNREIAKRKKAEDKLKKSNSEWQNTFDSIQDLVFIQDANFNIVKANKAFIEAMKMKPEDIIGKKCYKILHMTDKPWPNCPFAQTKIDMKMHREEVYDPKIKTPLLITTSPIFDDNGRLLGSVHVATDITERKKAEDALKALYKDLADKNKELTKIDRLKSDFVSTVSHELRTPLSITKEGISLVLDGLLGDLNEKQTKVLNMSRDNIDRLARIINDILDISKIEAGKIELKKILINLSYELNDVHDKWKSEAEKKSETLEFNIPGPLVNIYIDHDKMHQILDNLISNAIKYTGPGGRIKVNLVDKKDQVEISVSDTGMGIAKEDLPKVFGKFQQFSRTTGPGAKGTGLGLAIAKQLVEMHKGKITVESEINKGTKVTVLFPKMNVEEVFKEYINNGIREAEDKNAPLSLIVMHIQNFDRLQKEAGHDKTRNLLTDMEKVVKDSLRRYADTVVKDTGDLIILLFDTDKEDVSAVKERIEKAVSVYFTGNKGWGKDVYVTLGSATYPEEGKDEEELLKKASSRTPDGAVSLRKSQKNA